MAELVKKTLVLTFGTEKGKEATLTVNAPKEELTGAQVTAAMNAIVASGAFGEESKANSVVGAKYVLQQVEAISIA